MGKKLAIIGNGMAAARLAEELTRRAPGRYAIAIVGDEPRLAYNRVLLSALLAREASLDEIELKPMAWWWANRIKLMLGRPARSVDVAARRVTLTGGATLDFDRLVFATGSQPIRPPMPGIDLPGVVAFRDLDDVAAMARAAAPGTRVVMIGGGLLGLEAAHGLMKAGARVTVLHLMDRLMERQLDGQAAAMLKRAIERRGIVVVTGAETARIAGVERVEAVELKDGRSFDADLVVVAVGVRPNIALARDAGVATGRGVVVDDRLETNIGGIHAIGDCAEHRGQCHGLVESAHAQAAALAQILAGDTVRYPGCVPAASLKVTGIGLFSAGDFLGERGGEAIVLSDPGRGSYRKLVLRDGRLAGAVLYGDSADSAWYRELIGTGEKVAAFRGELAFGRALAASAAA